MRDVNISQSEGTCRDKSGRDKENIYCINHYNSINQASSRHHITYILWVKATKNNIKCDFPMLCMPMSVSVYFELQKNKIMRQTQI